jgi:hypothetical protein
MPVGVMMHSRLERIRRGFHRLALFLAETLLIFGLVLMALDLADLWRFRPEDIPTDIVSALWAAVRAFGWLVLRFLVAMETRE